MSNHSNRKPYKFTQESEKLIRPLFDLGTEVPAPVEAKQEMENPEEEARRIVSRLAALIEDHRRAAQELQIDLDSEDLAAVISSLRKHARGQTGIPVSGARDEIHGHCLNRLFEELVEEPSNILFSTQKGSGTVRYDAMNARFWIECLDLLERTFCKPK